MDKQQEVRVAILEERSKNIDNDIFELKEISKQTAADVSELKYKILQTNGAIPHMQEDVKLILSRMNKEALKTHDIGLKMKILWSILALGVGSLVTHIIHHLLLAK